MIYPIRFEPIYQEFDWGGHKMAAKFARPLQKRTIAESWEIVDNEKASSVIVNGSYKGRKLHDLIAEMGESLLGAGQKYNFFPLFVKILDAEKNQKKSKIEICWVALDESVITVGADKHQIVMKKGDAIHPSGTHTVMAHSFLLEVRQNPEIEKEDAKKLPSLSEHKRLQSDLKHQHLILVSCPFFIIDRFDIFKQFHLGPIPKTFQILFVIQGEGTVSVNGHKEPFAPGMTFLIPAACSGIEVEGKCELLRIRLA